MAGPEPLYTTCHRPVAGLTAIQAGLDDEPPRLVRTVLPDEVTALTTARPEAVSQEYGATDAVVGGVRRDAPFWKAARPAGDVLMAAA